MTAGTAESQAGEKGEAAQSALFSVAAGAEPYSGVERDAQISGKEQKICCIKDYGEGGTGAFEAADLRSAFRAELSGACGADHGISGGTEEETGELKIKNLPDAVNFSHPSADNISRA